jgi:hypothetical protein
MSRGGAQFGWNADIVGVSSRAAPVSTAPLWGCGKRVAGGMGRLGTLLGPEGTNTPPWVALQRGAGCRRIERPVSWIR